MTPRELRQTSLLSGTIDAGIQTSMCVAGGANLLPLTSRQSGRLQVRARACLGIFILVLLASSVCRAQGTHTAASCSQSDVNAVINGPTHKAVSGDVIVIPTTGSPCIWTSGISISGIGIDITGTGTPNAGGGTFGAGSPTTTLIDNASGPLFIFKNLSYGQTAKVELLNLSAAGAATNALVPGSLSFQGACTSAGCANIRVDNITWVSNNWGLPIADGAFVVCDGVFGVVDHNTVNDDSWVSGGGAGPPLVDESNSSWEGVGSYGDNSFATADTFGTAQQLYIENNSITYIRMTDNDVAPIGGTVGGARLTCRFNQTFNENGSGVCTSHGTAWGGRFRGTRQLEAYYNQTECTPGAACNLGFGIASGTGYFFSNTYITSGKGSGFNFSVGLSLYRTEGLGQSPWNNCDGTQPWDQTPWNSTSACLDEPGSRGELLLENATPVLASASSTACAAAGQCWTQNVADPVYEAGDTGAFNSPMIISDPTRLAGYYYAEVSQSAQTTSSSPFNGSTGTGYGAFANRPTSCTNGVGYWATDQGSWNTYKSSQEGELFVCTSGNNWTMQYQPFTYPHPLTTGGTSSSGNPPNPPTSLTAAVE